jgi:hypothetical protein
MPNYGAWIADQRADNRENIREKSSLQAWKGPNVTLMQRQKCRLFYAAPHTKNLLLSRLCLEFGRTPVFSGHFQSPRVRARIRHPSNAIT